MNPNQFSSRLQTAYQQAEELYNHDSRLLLQQPELLTNAVEQLRTALEELRVAEEELVRQNEQLAAAHQMVEIQSQRYQDLFEFAPDGYLVTNTRGTIQEVNCAAARMLGVEQKFLVGKPLVLFVATEDRNNFHSQLSRQHQVESLPEWEIRIQPRHGEPFCAAVTVAATHDCMGTPVALRWLLRDITARKQAEAQIRKMQLQNLQLQEVSRLKSKFLAMMSHELRTPMNAILGFSQLLLRNARPQLAPHQSNMVERIFNSGKNLLKLIDQILDFSNIEAGYLELNLEEFNLTQLVSQTIEQLRYLAEQKNLDLEILCYLHNPEVVNDQVRLQQVLVNLLSNAIKFTEAGNIGVEISDLPSDRIMISVKDTGIGIAEADFKQIFKEFQQVSEVTTRTHGGTGLGLATADRLVRLMQGTITVESQLKQGSTFRIELPRRVMKNDNLTVS